MSIRKNLVNYVGLGEFYGPFYLLFFMEPEVILYLSFVRQLIAFFKFVDNVVNGAVFLGNDDTIVYLNHKKYVLLFLDTFIHLCLSEAYIHKTFVEVSISYSSSLLFLIKVLVEEEYVGLCITFFKKCAWREFHIKIKFNDYLWEYQHKVNLSCRPIVEEVHDKKESYEKPSYYW